MAEAIQDQINSVRSQIEQERQKVSEYEKEANAIETPKRSLEFQQQNPGFALSGRVEQTISENKRIKEKALMQIAKAKAEINSYESDIVNPAQQKLTEYEEEKRAYANAYELWSRGVSYYWYQGQPEYKYLKYLYDNNGAYKLSTPEFSAIVAIGGDEISKEDLIKVGYLPKPISFVGDVGSLYYNLDEVNGEHEVYEGQGMTTASKSIGYVNIESTKPQKRIEPQMNKDNYFYFDLGEFKGDRKYYQGSNGLDMTPLTSADIRENINSSPLLAARGAGYREYNNLKSIKKGKEKALELSNQNIAKILGTKIKGFEPTAFKVFNWGNRKKNPDRASLFAASFAAKATTELPGNVIYETGEMYDLLNPGSRNNKKAKEEFRNLPLLSKIRKGTEYATDVAMLLSLKPEMRGLNSEVIVKKSAKPKPKIKANSVVLNIVEDGKMKTAAGFIITGQKSPRYGVIVPKWQKTFVDIVSPVSKKKIESMGFEDLKLRYNMARKTMIERPSSVALQAPSLLIENGEIIGNIKGAVPMTKTVKGTLKRTSGIEYDVLSGKVEKGKRVKSIDKSKLSPNEQRQFDDLINIKSKGVDVRLNLGDDVTFDPGSVTTYKVGKMTKPYRKGEFFVPNSGKKITRASLGFIQKSKGAIKYPNEYGLVEYEKLHGKISVIDVSKPKAGRQSKVQGEILKDFGDIKFKTIEEEGVTGLFRGRTKEIIIDPKKNTKKELIDTLLHEKGHRLTDAYSREDLIKMGVKVPTNKEMKALAKHLKKKGISKYLLDEGYTQDEIFEEVFVRSYADYYSKTPFKRKLIDLKYKILPTPIKPFLRMAKSEPFAMPNAYKLNKMSKKKIIDLYENKKFYTETKPRKSVVIEDVTERFEINKKPKVEGSDISIGSTGQKRKQTFAKNEQALKSAIGSSASKLSSRLNQRTRINFNTKSKMKGKTATAIAGGAILTRTGSAYYGLGTYERTESQGVFSNNLSLARGDQLTKFNLRYNEKNVFGEISKNSNKEISREITREMTKPVTKEIAREILKPITKEMQKTMSKSIAKQIIKQTTKTPPKILSPKSPRIPKTPRIPKGLGSFGSRKKQKVEGIFGSKSRQKTKYTPSFTGAALKISSPRKPVYNLGGYLPGIRPIITKKRKKRRQRL